MTSLKYLWCKTCHTELLLKFLAEFQVKNFMIPTTIIMKARKYATFTCSFMLQTFTVTFYPRGRIHVMNNFVPLHAECRMNGWMNYWIHGCIHKWMNEWIPEYTYVVHLPKYLLYRKIHHCRVYASLRFHNCVLCRCMNAVFARWM